MSKMAGVVRKIVQTAKAPGAVGPYRLVHRLNFYHFVSVSMDDIASVHKELDRTQMTD